MRTFLTSVIGAVSLSAVFTSGAAGMPTLIMPDSSENRIVQFDPVDGSVINETFIDLEPLDPGTPVHAIAVGDEIWLADQIRDRIDRFSLDGMHLGAIGGQVPGGGLDNIRGLSWDGANTVYVANASDSWDAPGTAVVIIDVDALEPDGHFTLPDDDSPWFPLLDGEDLFVSTITEHRIQQFDLVGNHIDLIYQGDPVGNARFIQQIHLNEVGNFYAAAFSAVGDSEPGVYEIDLEGNELMHIPESGVRGVWELGNGNILWSNSGGVHVYDIDTSMNTTVYSGTGRMFGLLPDDAEPCPWDLTGSGTVGVGDLLALLDCWGPVDPGDECEAADFTDDGAVGVGDLLELLDNWGDCP